MDNLWVLFLSLLFAAFAATPLFLWVRYWEIHLKTLNISLSTAEIFHAAAGET